MTPPCPIVLDTFRLFSGNVDAKKIRETAKAYGFSDKGCVDGQVLRQVKEHRNDLAHGVESFQDLGKELAAEQLRGLAVTVLWYLRSVLGNVETYLSTQAYLAQPKR
ncbi:MAG: MAE_28990/MAE_18760 family HEPN-like nuclease [Nannocystaceae bacterium]